MWTTKPSRSFEYFLTQVQYRDLDNTYLKYHTALNEIVKCNNSSALTVKLHYQDIIESFRELKTWRQEEKKKRSNMYKILI